MIEGITGQATLCCSQCGKSYVLGEDDFDFQTESGSERGMGEETQYISEHEQICDSCKQEIHVEFEVCEYPTGIVNHSTHTETGASSVESEFNIIHAPEEPKQEEESNRMVGAAAGGAILGASLGGPFGALIGGVIGGILGDSVNKSKKGEG